MASELRQKTQEAVDKLRERINGCNLAILIDPETNLVLCKSSEKSVSQDQLDLLADSAQLEVKGALASALKNNAADEDLLTAFNIGKHTIVAVIKSLGKNEDMLVCQFKIMPNRSDLRDAAEYVFNLSTDVEAA